MTTIDTPTASKWRFGIDVGGTFTDGLAWQEDAGLIRQVKVLSTPDDPARAFMNAVTRLMGTGGIAGGSISYLAHGTTVATNAVLEGQLAATAFVTTQGFRDLLEIARQVRPDPYDVFAVKPKPLVPRRLCFEVAERVAADGAVLVPLADDAIDALVDLLRDAPVDAVAVCLLHAYVNPAHERRISARLAAALPRLAVSISSDLASEFREFPRACTAIINAGLMPVASRYLERLDAQLAARSITRNRLVMQSNGGTADFARSAERPVFMIESGPAAGVVGAAHLAKTFGHANVISFDMGGTTAKAGLVQNATPHRVQEFEIGAEANRSRGWFAGAAGYPILTPAVDLVEIGTGGGSIAWIDSGGKLRVGPHSAGANPGPACYGQQGDHATITDANLILGRLNPDYFLGGEMKLDLAAARRAVSRLADRLSMDLLATAAGIIQIADAAMSQALRVVSVQRGYDPRDFHLIAFGGAGPLHAVSLAMETGIPSVLVPPRPGLASAFGLLVADMRHDFARTMVQRLDRCDPALLEGVLVELTGRAEKVLSDEGVASTDAVFERAADVRYVGQSYQLTIPIGGDVVTAATLITLRDRFNALHRTTYGYADPAEPCEIVNLRVSARGGVAKPALGDGSVAGGPEDAHAASTAARPVYFADQGFLDCTVHNRLRLGIGTRLVGPAVIEEPDSATLVHPGWSARVDRFGVLAIERMG